MYENCELVVDADGFVWWRYETENSGMVYSMARTNPDNRPIPFPVTVYRVVAE